MKMKLTERSQKISVFDFDYFSEDNDYCYDGITPSYKFFYEKSSKKLTLEKYQKHLLKNASYARLDGVFRKVYIVTDFTDYLPTLTIRQKAYMKFTRNMLNAFLHEADEALRNFLRKPDNPRKILT
jgi:hypothetical protein